MLRTKAVLVSMIISGVASSANALGDNVVFRDLFAAVMVLYQSIVLPIHRACKKVVRVVSRVVSVQQHVAARS